MDKPKYLIILSVDSLSSPDMELVSLLPNFRNFINNAATCDNVTSVYPSLTYPAHATIDTGKYPVHHGVVNNTFFEPQKKSADWYWERRLIQGTTFIDEAIKSGKKVASILWPTTGKSKIKYNLPEVFPNKWYETQAGVCLKNGSKRYILELNRKFGKLRDGVNQPGLDNFVQASLLHTIKKYRPDITLVHYLDLDKNRHMYGYAAPEAFRAMERMDSRLGELIQTLKDEGIYEETTIVILGDHSQIDVHTPIYLNDRFEKDGYLTRKKGRVTDWEIYAKPCDGSCYIFLKNPKSEKLCDEIYEYLYTIQGERKSGIGKIYTSEEAQKFGASDECSFMLEARIGYYFAENKEEPVLKAAHGYLPTIQSYQTVFMASGPGIKKNIQVSNVSLVDEAPTLAKLMGLELRETDGRCIEEILE